ncbi:acid protease [Hesseltinella vesiculosa]|uniref:Acid protease n=1 Tax=Hesseltinella vesiculosa TaxID=101127 RepID=A0A1X2G527_9FUNG|nr:acid protease [Hesseltinella vesiculosa]
MLYPFIGLIYAGAAFAFTAPSLQDQFLTFPDVGHLLKIPLNFIHGIPTLDIGFGTPPQLATAVFDTGSLVSWCNSTACTQASSVFHREQSSTNTAFDYTIEIKYIDGSSARVLPELDKLTFPGIISIPRHLMGEALQVTLGKDWPEHANARFALGDFGAFEKYLSNAKGLVEGVKQLVQGVLHRAVADDRTSTGFSAPSAPDFKKRDGIHGQFEWVLGPDPAKYVGPLHELELMPAGKVVSPYWKLPMRGIQLFPENTIPVSDVAPEQRQDLLGKLLPLRLDLEKERSHYGIIESSTPYLHLPLRLSQALNAKIGAQFDPDAGVYTIECDRIKQEPYWLALEFNGLDAILPPHQYIIRRGGQCHSAIKDNPQDDTVIHLGGPFFRSFYLEFHTMAKKVGIAESVIHNGLLRPHSSDPTLYTNLIDHQLPLLEI